ncbi:hypothetical protein Tco_0244497, partial [Tanacetum coccineum]
MFLRGLKNDIRDWVRTLNPLTCHQAMEFARNVEIATTLNESKSGTRAKPGSLSGTKGYYQTQSWKSSPREIGSRPDKSTQSYSSFGASSKATQPNQTVVHSNDRPNSTFRSSGLVNLLPSRKVFGCPRGYQERRKGTTMVDPMAARYDRGCYMGRRLCYLL